MAVVPWAEILLELLVGLAVFVVPGIYRSQRLAELLGRLALGAGYGFRVHVELVQFLLVMLAVGPEEEQGALRVGVIVEHA